MYQNVLIIQLFHFQTTFTWVPILLNDTSIHLVSQDRNTLNLPFFHPCIGYLPKNTKSCLFYLQNISMHFCVRSPCSSDQFFSLKILHCISNFILYLFLPFGAKVILLKCEIGHFSFLIASLAESVSFLVFTLLSRLPEFPLVC